MSSDSDSDTGSGWIEKKRVHSQVSSASEIEDGPEMKKPRAEADAGADAHGSASSPAVGKNRDEIDFDAKIDVVGDDDHEERERAHSAGQGEKDKTPKQVVRPVVIRTLTTAQPWEHEFKNPESWRMGEKKEWGKESGVFSAFVITEDSDLDKPRWRVFHTPPGVVFKEPWLHGLGALKKNGSGKEDHQHSLVLNFGNLSPEAQERYPWLMEQHQKFIDVVEETTPFLLKKIVMRGDDAKGIKLAKAAASDAFSSEHRGYGTDHYPVMDDMVKVLLADGVVKDVQEARNYIMISELLIPGESSTDRKSVSARTHIIQLLGDRIAEYQKAKLNDLFWKTYAKNMKHIGYIMGETKGQRTMTIYLTKGSTYIPKKLEKGAGSKPRRQVKNPNLQAYFDFCNSEWTTRKKWPVRYYGQNGRPLPDKETGETYNTLTDDEHDPFLQVINQGDLVSVGINIRTYYDNNAHLGTKAQPDFGKVVVFTRGIPDAAEMLGDVVVTGDMPAMADDFGFF